jgi:decaprenylphospho-beta-D-ribofuranose 2-oxidase
MNPIRSYDRYFAGESIVRPVSTEDQIRDAFREAKSSRKRVVIRGSGHSFHDQALHDGDKGTAIVLDVSGFQNELMEVRGDQVRLGAGVQWGHYFEQASGHAKRGKVLIPASMQTGRKSTVGGTLSGDCLSRFSGTMGKESRSIVSFRLLTTELEVLDVSPTNHPQLFNAVVGGFGYLGFVLEATYKMVGLDRRSIARTKITLHNTFADLVQRQLDLVRQYDGQQRAISSGWFTEPSHRNGPERIKGMVFESWYDLPSVPRQPGFLLYGDFESESRYLTELLARTEPANMIGHETLYLQAQIHKGSFENDLKDFLFFMDGNTIAKERFERETEELFPIIQQTFVIPVEKTAEFAEFCEGKLLEYQIRPTESDMLYVKADDCLMSGNYKMDGFAVSFGFELLESQDPGPIRALLGELTKKCVGLGGRLHLVKNAYAGKDLLRSMYGQQILDFEEIKHQYDPSGILQNTFSDKLFNF